MGMYTELVVACRLVKLPNDVWYRLGMEEAADRVRRTTFPPVVVLCKGEASK